MPYVITEACVDVKDRGCIAACPVDCIYELIDGRMRTPAGNEHPAAAGVDNRQLYINPSECINCGACEPTCPVEAIVFDAMLSPEEEAMRWKNAEAFLSRAPGHAQFGH